MSSVFPRIPPEHPLTEAARYANAYSEEHGLEKTVEWAEMDVSVGELAYLAEQRAYRAIAGAMGMNLGSHDPEHGSMGLEDQIVHAIKQTPLWRDFGPTLMASYMDGFVIGWVGRGLRDQT